MNYANRYGYFDDGDQLAGLFSKIKSKLVKVSHKITRATVPKVIRKAVKRISSNPIFKIVSTIALSVVASAVLGPMVGQLVSKLGAAASTSVNAATAARIGKTINAASKVYKTVKRVKGATEIVKGVKQYKKVKKTISRMKADAKLSATMPALPPYSPVPYSINSPAMFELAKAETMRTLSTDPAYTSLSADDKKLAESDVDSQIRDLQARVAAALPTDYRPAPSAALGLSEDAEAAQIEDGLASGKLTTDASGVVKPSTGGGALPWLLIAGAAVALV